MRRHAAHASLLSAAFAALLTGFTILVGAIGTAVAAAEPVGDYAAAVGLGAAVLLAGLAIGAWSLRRLRR